MRGSTVVLWDIDGTLVRSRGIGVRAFIRAVERGAGVVWAPRPLDFGGRTDPAIAALILEDVGLTDPALVAPVLDALATAYEEMADELRAAVLVLPGVHAAVAALETRGALQTVVTGNIRAVAAAKVEVAGLTDQLRLELGGFGSDHLERAELVRLALERTHAAGVTFRPAEVWVIGDTPRDLACARANGVRCALVATGTYDAEELRRLDADLVLDDLSDTRPLLDAVDALDAS